MITFRMKIVLNLEAAISQIMNCSETSAWVAGIFLLPVKQFLLFLTHSYYSYYC